MGENIIVNSENIVGLIQRTLNEVDPRLVDHGICVSYIVSRMLEVDGEFSEEEKQNICILSVLHDIGAYKTEEIDRLVQFETSDVWEHSIYGYLFLRYLSPLKEWSEAILFHHVPVEELPSLRPEIRKAAQVINLADRIEIFSRNRKGKDSPKEMSSLAMEYLERLRGRQFSNEVVECFKKAEIKFSIFDRLLGQSMEFQEVLPKIRLSEEECIKYLIMLIYAIDFRSQHTVTHTITTTCISCCCARYMGISAEQIDRIQYGALLHDLGKIGIPVEILEYPGKLSSQAMNVMRTHVDITEKILGGTVAPDVARISLRHHEKRDGSGYPRGLKEEDMTMEEQIVAVSDIVSALLGTRSYKEAFSKERTLKIIQGMSDEGKLNPKVVSVMQEHFSEIIEEVVENCAPALEKYYGIQSEYRRLLVKYL